MGSNYNLWGEYKFKIKILVIEVKRLNVDGKLRAGFPQEFAASIDNFIALTDRQVQVLCGLHSVYYQERSIHSEEEAKDYLENLTVVKGKKPL